MRVPKYLSPTSVGMFESDRMEFYLKYLADNRPPKIPQTRPMSIGSSFDAYVKSYIVDKLVGLQARPEFALTVIFEKQVEKHNRDWALKHGAYVFECYKRSGALADLMIELELASAEPRFEFTVQRIINDIPLLGKPDIWFTIADALNVLLDWKVNGYCSKSATSPKPGYIICADGWDGERLKHSRGHRQPHKNAQLVTVQGMTINAGTKLEYVDQKWADQTTIYGWLMGEEIGGRFITGIDQIVGKPVGGTHPLLRVARHRAYVSADYQHELWKRIEHCWDTIQSGHIFDNMTREESDARCSTLDDYHKAYDGDDPKEKWFQEITREQRAY